MVLNICVTSCAQHTTFFPWLPAWFEASVTVWMRSSLFWDVMQHGLVVCYQHFWTICQSHFASVSVSPRLLAPWRWSMMHNITEEQRSPWLHVFPAVHKSFNLLQALICPPDQFLYQYFTFFIFLSPLQFCLGLAVSSLYFPCTSMKTHPFIQRIIQVYSALVQRRKI